MKTIVQIPIQIVEPIESEVNMTREEAINRYIMPALKRTWNDNLCAEIQKALEKEPCSDAVSRQAVLEQTYLWSKDEFLRVTNPFDYLRKRINSLPPVKQEQTGHWINAKVGKMFPSNDYKCSECGNILDFDGVNCGRGDAHYCPNCGAKMAEGSDKE